MRKDVTRDRTFIEEILDHADLLHLALCDADGPFCVPVNFARQGDTLYVHSGLAGRKVQALANGPAGFSVVVDAEQKTSQRACKWGYRFRSVRGTVRTRRIDDEAGRAAALEAIVRRYAGRPLPVDEAALGKTLLFALDIVEATARIKD